MKTVPRLLLAGLLPACGPLETRNTVIIQQPKPLEVNVNLSGKLELVITDARKDLETITGEEPKREVRPEDIGLPPDATTVPASGSPGASPGAAIPAGSQPVALLSSITGVAPPTTRFIAATEDQVIAALKARHAEIRKLLSAKLVGEAHTGLLVEKGTLSADQSKTMAAENADRSTLYELRAAKNHTTPAAAALAYYLQRLGYVEKGDWVEIFNKQSKQWEWTQWSK